MRTTLLRAGLLLGLTTIPAVAFAQKALVYCPTADQSGCNVIVNALSTAYPDGVDRAYDGTGGTLDLRTLDHSVYSVFVVPSLADDATTQPYAFLRDSAVVEHLRSALIGGLAVWSGFPDQGTANRESKDQLIRNLAAWAGKDYATAKGPGLVALLDLSEVEGARYDWLRAITPLQLTSDVTFTTYDSVRTLTATGAAISGSLSYESMAALGLATPTATPGLRLDALGATGTSTGGQVVLATLAGGNTSTAKISTDKLDYSPGTPVVITGSGWTPGEAVTITLHEDPLLEQDSSWVAVADGFGNFSNSVFAPDVNDVGTRFVLTADGGTSGMRAQATFTDGAQTMKFQTSVGFPSGQSVTVTAMSSGPGACTSGCSTTFTSGGTPGSLSFDGNATITYSATSSFTIASVTYTYAGGSPASPIASGWANNLTVTLNYPHVASTTSITSDTPDPSVVGQPVTVGYSVTGSGGTPSGNVTVSDGVNSCTGTVAAGSCSITLTTAGARTLTASYAGDSNFLPSTSAGAAHMVSQASTTVSLARTTGASPAPYGTSLTFTATVTVTSPGSGTPTGTVTFFDGATSIGTGTLSATSPFKATFTTSSLSVAVHSITAVYTGDASFAASPTSSPVGQTVTTATTTTTVATSDNSTVFGESVTFTATVTPQVAGSTPTGTVTFKDGATTIGTGTLDGGSPPQATFTTSALSVATHPITASYGGDGNFSGDASPSINQVVAKAATTTTLTSSPNPSLAGQSVTLTATVSVTAPGDGTPSGTVNFRAGTSSIAGCGAVSLAAGQATCTTTFAATATNLNGVYSGDGNFATSTSPNFTQTVTSNQFTASVSPTAVQPSTTQAFTIPLTSGAASTSKAQNARISIPAGFAVTSITGTATVTNNTCTGAVAGQNWTASGTGPINVNSGAAGSQLCPGATVTVTFNATAPATTGAYTFTTEMFSGNIGTGPFAITSAQPVVTVSSSFTVTPSSSGHGTISPSTPQSVSNGATTAFTLTPDAGYHIVPVTGTCGGSLVGNTFTTAAVTADCTVVANFAINTYTLTYTAGANGTISGTSPQTVNYGASGSAVTAVPNAGYHFTSWSDGVLTASRTDANATADISVTANFAINTYTLTYTAGANGTISGTSPQAVNGGANGSTVTAVPNTGYHFMSWSDGVLTASRTDMNVTANISVTASFAINTYTLTYTAGANGTLTGTSPQTVNYGANGTAVTAVPNAHYHFVSWSDGVLTASRTDMNVTANISVTASFAIDQYTLTYTAGTNGTLTGTSPQTVDYDGSGTAVTAVPNLHCHFVNWSDGSTANPRTDTHVTANLSVTANFTIDTYTLTYTAGANGTLTGTSPQTVNYGANGTAVTAVPNTHYHFVSWSDGVLTASRTDMNVTANISVTASFAIDQYTLTYTAGANGTLTGTSPQTVNYGANGTAVTAVPNTHYHFVSWSDGVLTASRTDMNVTANISVTASFAIDTYTLAYTAGANGTLTGSTSQTVDYDGSGTAVTAVPNLHYHFVNWSDGSTANPRTDTHVTANLSVTANFAIDQYTLAYTAGANGTLTGTSPQTVDYGASGSPVTAVPNTGYHFTSWSDGVLTASRTDANVTANISVTANFAINTYTLTYTAGANGTISGTSPQTVNHGVSGTAVTAVPNTGYHFVDWSDASTANPRTGANVTANISVTASFAINTYTLTYTAGANGTISGTSPQTVNYGASGSPVTAVPNTGYHFTSWSDGVLTAARTDANVTADISVTASFAINTYTVTPSAGTGGSISPSTPQTVNYNTTTAFTVTPSTGYHINTVTGCGGSLAGSTYTTGAITADCAVSATFALNMSTTGVASSLNPSTFGTSVTFTATVAPVAPATGTPDGTVTFTIDGTAVPGSVALVSGHATYATSTLAVGNHTVRADYSGSANFRPSYGSLTGGQQVNVYVTTTSVTVTPSTQQYSDRATFVATVSPDLAGGYAPATSVDFYVGTQKMNSTPVALVASGGQLTATLSNAQLIETVAGQMAPGLKTVTAKFNGKNSNFTVNDPTTSLTITKEDAAATYTGALFASTGSATSSTATVTLAATIQDITALNPETDPDAGDIRKATVKFVNRDAGDAVLCTATVGLVSLSDTKTGTATCNWTASLGTALSMSPTVGIIVDGYYTRNSSDDDQIVTVSVATTGFITGGGYLVMSSSAGQYPGATGSKNNFGFNVKYNKQGTNLQGNINAIVRNNGHVYQIKGNSMTSLSSTITSSTTGAATFNGKASIQDITNPLNIISIDGNATLQVTMTDNGEPGSSDTIAITVWNKSGGLWFSSKWSGTKTLEQVLGGGNLQVR